MEITYTPDERESRLGGIVAHTFAPQTLIAALRDRDQYFATGRNGTVLARYPELQMVLEVLREGKGLTPHRAPAAITLQVLEGELRFEAEGEVIYLHQGEVLVLAAGVQHAVEAVTDAAFLLTIGKRGTLASNTSGQDGAR